MKKYDIMLYVKERLIMKKPTYTWDEKTKIATCTIWDKDNHKCIVDTFNLRLVTH